jgi:hypothetical protein
MGKCLKTSLALSAALCTLANPVAGQPAQSTPMKIAARPLVLRAINAEVIVVGKVTSIEKDLVQATQSPGTNDAAAYRIAIVKVESTIAGADKLTEIKVGFVPKPDPNVKQPGGVIRPIRPGMQAPELKEGQESIFFLARHPSGKFYVMPSLTPPVDATTEQGKKDLEIVERVANILSDPAKALKSDKPEERAEAAAVIILKYRSSPLFGGETEQVAVPQEESTLLLKALSEGEWSRLAAPGTLSNVSPVQAFQSLSLTDNDGWVAPAIAPSPGGLPVDYNAILKDAFHNWLEGRGKNYRIKKIVPRMQK